MESAGNILEMQVPRVDKMDIEVEEMTDRVQGKDCKMFDVQFEADQNPPSGLGNERLGQPVDETCSSFAASIPAVRRILAHPIAILASAIRTPFLSTEGDVSAAKPTPNHLLG